MGQRWQQNSKKMAPQRAWKFAVGNKNQMKPGPIRLVVLFCSCVVPCLGARLEFSPQVDQRRVVEPLNGLPKRHVLVDAVHNCGPCATAEAEIKYTAQHLFAYFSILKALAALHG